MEAFCKMQYFKDANFKVCLVCGNKSQERKRTAHYIKKKKSTQQNNNTVLGMRIRTTDTERLLYVLSS